MLWLLSFSQGFHPRVPSVTPPGDPGLGDRHRKAQGAATTSSSICQKCKPRSGFSPMNCKSKRRKLPLGHLGAQPSPAQPGDSLHLTGQLSHPEISYQESDRGS